MATYTIQGPDGRTYSIDGPEGATRDQIVAAIQSRIGAQIPQAAPVNPYTETAQGQSAAQNLLAGIGGGMKSLYLGGKQMLGMDEPGEIAEHQRAMEGLRSTTAGTIGDIGGQIVAALPAALMPGAQSLVGASLTGAGLGALQPVAEGESRALNVGLGAAGGALGQKAANVVAKTLGGQAARPMPQQAARPMPQQINVNLSGQGTITPRGVTNYGAAPLDVAGGGLSKPQQAIMNKARDMGFKVTPGQAAGSKTLQMREASLESMPLTSKPFMDLRDHNQTVLNRIAAKSIGETSDTVDNATLAAAHERISNVYKTVADDVAKPLDADDFAAKFNGLMQQYEGLLPENFAKNSLVSRFVNLAESGEATGRQLQNLASQMGKVAQSNMSSASGDRQLGMAMFDLKNMADDYLQAGLKGETAKLFKDARQQYRNLMLLTPGSGNINPSTGDVMGGALARTLQQKDRSGFLFGKNKSDLYEAARFSQAFKPLVPNSGTATRLSTTINSPTDYLLSLPTNLAAQGYLSQPMVNIAAARGQMAGQGLLPGVGAAIDPTTARLLPLLGGVGAANLSNY